MLFENFDHVFIEILRGGKDADDLIIAGDSDTLGDGAISVGNIDLFDAPLGSEKESLLVVSG